MVYKDHAQFDLLFKSSKISSDFKKVLSTKLLNCGSKFMEASLQNYIQEKVFSCEFCEIFKNIFFYRTPLVAAYAFACLNLIKYLFLAC